MKLNKMMLAGILGLGVVSGANAADGKLTITGLIKDTACVVSANGGDIPVALGTVNKGAFVTNGAPVAGLGFDIAITGCAANKDVMVRFNGISPAGSPGLIDVPVVTGGATGVAIGLYEENGTAIPLNTDSAPQKTDSAGAATLKYVAAYVAPDITSVMPGTVMATADFTIMQP